MLNTGAVNPFPATEALQEEAEEFLPVHVSVTGLECPHSWGRDGFT